MFPNLDTVEKIPSGVYFANGVPHPEVIRKKMEEKTLLTIDCTLIKFIEGADSPFVKIDTISSISQDIKYKSDNYYYFFKSSKLKPFPVLAYIDDNLLDGVSSQNHDGNYLQGVLRLVYKELGGVNCVYGNIYDTFYTSGISKYSYHPYSEAIKMKGFY